MPFMLIGVLISLYRLAKIAKCDLVFGLICVTASFLMAPMRWFVSIDKGVPTWGLATVVFLVVLIYAKQVKIVKKNLGQSLGNISYPMYAIHPAMATLVVSFLANLNYIQKTLIFLSLTLLFSIIVNRVIELPSIGLSKRSWKKRQLLSSSVAIHPTI
jgi:peptidoglycan/LPS O-acetylase OafA/YrhL